MKLLKSKWFQKHKPEHPRCKLIKINKQHTFIKPQRVSTEKWYFFKILTFWFSHCLVFFSVTEQKFVLKKKNQFIKKNQINGNNI